MTGEISVDLNDFWFSLATMADELSTLAITGINMLFSVGG